MKKYILVLMALLTSAMVQAGDTPDRPGRGHDRDRSHVVRIEGRINFGPYINCEISNHENYSWYEILRYHYAITFFDQWNQVRVNHHQLTCGFGCEVDPYHTVRLSGPRNGANVLSARCDATVRVFDYDPRYDNDNGGDDYPIIMGGATSQELN